MYLWKRCVGSFAANGSLDRLEDFFERTLANYRTSIATDGVVIMQMRMTGLLDSIYNKQGITMLNWMLERFNRTGFDATYYQVNDMVHIPIPGDVANIFRKSAQVPIEADRMMVNLKDLFVDTNSGAFLRVRPRYFSTDLFVAYPS